MDFHSSTLFSRFGNVTCFAFPSNSKKEKNGFHATNGFDIVKAERIGENGATVKKNSRTGVLRSNKPKEPITGTRKRNTAPVRIRMRWYDKWRSRGKFVRVRRYLRIPVDTDIQG